MLAGEYSVLFGGKTLSSTVSGKIHIEARTKSDTQMDIPQCWRIDSDLWREEAYLNSADTETAFDFCPLKQSTMFARDFYQVQQGEVKVRSELDTSYGMGTSSAIRLGVIAGIKALSSSKNQKSDKTKSTAYPDNRKPNTKDWTVAHQALTLQRKGQTLASGYDIATQLIGGLVQLSFLNPASYEPYYCSEEPTTPQSYEGLNELVHVYVGGSGAPTTKTVKETITWIDTKKIAEQIVSSSNTLISDFIESFNRPSYENQSRLYQAIYRNRQLFYHSPHFPRKIADTLRSVNGCDHTWSFKTTGAGGEDAILLIGKKSSITLAHEKMLQLGWKPMPYQFSHDGINIAVET
ncbi:MAG: hypothetical protein R3B45_05480 [Bdellovibrionota bacterium]